MTPTDLRPQHDPADAPVGADSARPKARRRAVAFAPGLDTAIALGTLVVLTVGYWLTTTQGQVWALFAAAVIVGTIVPAWTIFVLRREGWNELGFTRRRLVVSLIVSAVLGAGSAFQVFQLAAANNVDPVPHLLANVFVFWEAFFVFGWLFLRWERAFGYIPAVLLAGLGFAFQHLGSVPLPQAVGFGMFGLVFAVIFAFTRNLFILWPLFYGVASGIGTLQSGIVFGWGEAVANAVLTVVQIVLLLGIAAFARRRLEEVSAAPDHAPMP